MLIGIVALGAAVRVYQYASNPSLELDELALARSIVESPLRQLLLAPLPFDQVAPRGFLMVEKGLVEVLGSTEYALRLWPLLCSVVSLVLFGRIALVVLRHWAVPFAVVLFALKPSFILYGAAVKQYSSDIAAVLLLILLAFKLRGHCGRWPQYLVIGVIGALIGLLSQAATFALLGIGFALVVLELRKGDIKALRTLSITVTLWGVGAAAAVLIGIHSMTEVTYTYMQLFWRDGFMPAPASLHGKNVAIWLWSRFYELFDLENLHAAWYEWPGLYIGLAFLGILSLWRRYHEACLIVLAPVMITLAASAAQQYPFKGRSVMFLAPIFLLTAAEGTDWLRRLWSSHLAFVGAIGMTLLAVLPLSSFFTSPPVYGREETKPMFAHIQAGRLPGDALYVYYAAWQAVSFYAARYGFGEGEYVIGGCHRGNTRAYLREIDRFRGLPRVWIVISHAIPSLQELPAIVGYLDQIGIRKESIMIPARMWDKTASVSNVADVHAYLYDLSDKARLALASAETFVLASPTTFSSLSAFNCHAGPHVPVVNRMAQSTTYRY